MADQYPDLDYSSIKLREGDAEIEDEEQVEVGMVIEGAIEGG